MKYAQVPASQRIIKTSQKPSTGEPNLESCVHAKSHIFHPSDRIYTCCGGSRERKCFLTALQLHAVPVLYAFICLS
jgi:hypothetical protein